MDMHGNNQQQIIPAAVVKEENNNIIETGSYANKYPIGYHFKPTDDELITHYLLEKIKNNPIPVEEINVVDVRAYDPQTLSERFPSIENKEWYFFTPRDRKYPKGTRPDRAAGNGRWKATASDKSITVDEKTIGFRKSLVYEIKPTRENPTGKTGWLMHEFRVNQPPRTKTDAQDMRLDDWVLCRIHFKPRKIVTREVDQVVPEVNAEENTIATNDGFAMASQETNHGVTYNNFVYQNFPVQGIPNPMVEGPSFANYNPNQSNVDQFQNWFHHGYRSMPILMSHHNNGSMPMLQNDFNDQQYNSIPMLQSDSRSNLQYNSIPVQNEFVNNYNYNQEFGHVGSDDTFNPCELSQLVGDAGSTHKDVQTNYRDDNQLALKRRRSM